MTFSISPDKLIKWTRREANKFLRQNRAILEQQELSGEIQLLAGFRSVIGWLMAKAGSGGGQRTCTSNDENSQRSSIQSPMIPHRRTEAVLGNNGIQPRES